MRPLSSLSLHNRARVLPLLRIWSLRPKSKEQPPPTPQHLRLRPTRPPATFLQRRPNGAPQVRPPSNPLHKTATLLPQRHPARLRRHHQDSYPLLRRLPPRPPTKRTSLVPLLDALRAYKTTIGLTLLDMGGLVPGIRRQRRRHPAQYDREYPQLPGLQPR